MLHRWDLPSQHRGRHRALCRVQQAGALSLPHSVPQSPLSGGGILSGGDNWVRMVGFARVHPSAAALCPEPVAPVGTGCSAFPPLCSMNSLCCVFLPLASHTALLPLSALCSTWSQGLPAWSKLGCAGHCPGLGPPCSPLCSLQGHR